MQYYMAYFTTLSILFFNESPTDRHLDPDKLVSLLSLTRELVRWWRCRGTRYAGLLLFRIFRLPSYKLFPPAPHWPTDLTQILDNKHDTLTDLDFSRRPNITQAWRWPNIAKWLQMTQFILRVTQNDKRIYEKRRQCIWNISYPCSSSSRGWRDSSLGGSWDRQIRLCHNKINSRITVNEQYCMTIAF